MDAGYGTNTRLREEIGALGLSYIAGIPPQTSVWPPGTAPLPPLPWSGRGRRPKLMRRDAEHQPVSVKALALGLPPASWQTVSWREGSAGALTSRFARVRVRAAHRDEWRAEPQDEEWLLIEWPQGDAEHHPVSVKALALGLPAASWQTISWREGSAGALISRFARVRVRAAHRDAWRTEPRDEEWLLIEWPEGDAEPAKYWLATQGSRIKSQ